MVKTLRAKKRVQCNVRVFWEYFVFACSKKRCAKEEQEKKPIKMQSSTWRKKVYVCCFYNKWNHGYFNQKGTEKTP